MASVVDLAVTALISILTADTGLAGVNVYDGPPMAAESLDWVAVGYQPGSTEAVTAQYDWAQIGQQRHEEHITILCSLATSTGDEPMGARRSRAVALRDIVAAALRANPTLNGSVRIAHMDSANLVQEQTPQGALAGYAFTVSAVARITS